MENSLLSPENTDSYTVPTLFREDFKLSEVLYT